MKLIDRPYKKQLFHRLREASPLIQVLVGPRQIGKTTAIQDILSQLKCPHVYVTADGVNPMDSSWLAMAWQEARHKGDQTILVIDEIQKIHQWSEQVKMLWDPAPHLLKVVLTGSSSLDLNKGLSESLAGRYEQIFAYHWNYSESRQIHPMSLEDYLKWGGYPGSYKFLKDPQRLENYLKVSIVENVLTKDILSLHKVKSPALFRQAFELICSYPAQIISYNKLLGQLQEGGNIDLVKYYLDLFEGAQLVKTLYKYTTKKNIKKSSSPKIIPLAPCFYHLFREPGEEDKTPFNFEASVGALLLQISSKLFYWREGDYEVDYVFPYKNQLYAIEVKSGRKKRTGGLQRFLERHPKAKPIFITQDNYVQFVESPLEFLT